AVANCLQCGALLLVVLPSVLAEFDRAVALDDPGKQTARPHCWELVQIADQHRLAASALDALEQASEDPRFGHSRFIDHEQASLRQLVSEQPVKCGRTDARLVLELLRRDSGRRAADYRNP